MYNKGIILEIKEKYSLIMTSDSTIVRIKNKEGMNIGDPIIFLEEDKYETNKTKISFIKNFSPILALAAIFLLFFFSPIFKNTAEVYSLVSFDVNPSIQLELDADQNIIKASGINDDGKSLDLQPLNGLSLKDGTLKLKEILETQGYVLENDSALIGFTFFNNVENTVYEKDLKTIFADSFNATKLLYLKGSKDNLDKATAQGISLGRYEAQLNMDDDLIEEKIEGMSVEEIMSLLNGKAGIYLNEEILDELEDELEDRLEDSNPETQNDDDDDLNETDDNDNHDNDDN